MWTAKDECGLTSSVSQVIHVVDTVAPVSCALVDSATPEVTASDACEANIKVNFEEKIEEQGCSHNYRSAADKCGNQVSASQVLTVFDNQVPEFLDRYFDSSASCSNVPELPGPPPIQDNCDAKAQVQPLTHIDKTQGRCAQEYAIVRAWEAKDACGHVAFMNHTVVIYDREAPVFLDAPADETVSCELLQPAVFPHAKDGCAGELVADASNSLFEENYIVGSIR